MKEFFSFDTMITPKIIKVLFWIGLVVSGIYGLILIFAGLGEGEGILSILGLVVFVVGALITRVYSELLIIMFKIHETLNDIKNK